MDVLWILELIPLIGFPVLVAVALFRGAMAAGLGRRTATAVAATTVAGWGGWIVTSGLLARSGFYGQGEAGFNPWLPLALLGTLSVALLLTGLPVMRRIIADPGTPARLAVPQTLRVVGVVFLIAMALDRLPAVFALPAGLGDIAIGLAAPFVAWRLYSGARLRSHGPRGPDARPSLVAPVATLPALLGPDRAPRGLTSGARLRSHGPRGPDARPSLVAPVATLPALLGPDRAPRGHGRTAAIRFNVLGIVDLVVAVGIGVLAGLGPVQVIPADPSTAAMTELPLVLVPTTLVPFAIALHVVSLRRLRAPDWARDSAGADQRTSRRPDMPPSTASDVPVVAAEAGEAR